MWKNKNSNLDDKICDIRLAIRLLKKDFEKYSKKENASIKKAQKSIMNNKNEQAELYAKHAIMNKNLAERSLSLALRIEIVESIALSSMNSNRTTKSISNLINFVSKQSCSLIDSNYDLVNFENTLDEFNISSNMLINSLTESTNSVENSNDDILLLKKLQDEISLHQKYPIVNDISLAPPTHNINRKFNHPTKNVS